MTSPTTDKTTFDLFWDAYQKKVGIDKARPKWYTYPRMLP